MNSEEEDEDYVPGVDGASSEDDDENDSCPVKGNDTSVLSITKQKAVDDAFADLFGLPTSPAEPSATGDSANVTSEADARKLQKQTVASVRAMRKKVNILTSIFGRSSCAKLFSNAKYVAALARPKACKGTFRLEKRVIKEVKRFAGREIKIERTVMVPVAGEADSNSSGASSQPPTSFMPEPGRSASSKLNAPLKGIDSVLSEISRPEKISTVAKTSADWDVFKEKSDLADELEKKALGNDAFLVKKDFLNRVDVRRFELEKTERERKRASDGR